MRSSPRSAYLFGLDVVVGRDAAGVPEDDDVAAAAASALAAVSSAHETPPEISREAAARPSRVLASEVPGVSDESWTDFARAMKTQDAGAVSASNGMGLFELKPRRLVDFGLMRQLSSERWGKRMVWKGEFVSARELPAWAAEILGPGQELTQDSFLKSPKLQYRIFGRSMRDYVDRLRSGDIPRPDGGKPDGMTLSGALAVLHRCGPSGLKTWNDAANRFEQTVTLYARTNGIF